MKCSDCVVELDYTNKSDTDGQCEDCHADEYLDYVNTLEDMVMEGYYED